ncbi:hypothetical protein ETU09_03400 [Apibacter muscae]|uniref:Glutamine cyclotransferase n=2 Tax=Apibacter muscae TaxID=2509004 RepID=A0A563DGC9_9FLAO|nr:hypothetical protein ETU09_03400 [Apibacter muscae]
MNAQKLAHLGSDYTLKKVIPVEGRQGIAVDKDYYYVSSSTALYKYDKQGNLITKNEKPFENFVKQVNHFGDIDIHNGEIYTGVEYFNSGNVENIQIAVYDAKDLKYKYSIEFGEIEQPEVSGITIDRKNNIAWMSDWTEGWYLYKYDLKNKKYLGKVHLQPSPQWQQGVYYIDGKILITSDDGDSDLNEPDNIYIANVSNPLQTTTNVEKFRSIPEFKKAGEIEGLSIDPTNNDLIILNNRGAIIKKGMPSGFYPGYDKEIHELYIFEKSK